MWPVGVFRIYSSWTGVRETSESDAHENERFITPEMADHL